MNSKTTALVTRGGIVIAAAMALLAVHRLGLLQLLSLEILKEKYLVLQDFFHSHPFEALGKFFGLYLLVSALSIPGATILALGAGFVFGFGIGTVVVSFASTLGATLAFLGSRFFFRQLIQSRFSEQLRPVNEGIQKDGALYLLSLRLIPIFPFFLVNLLMGLMPIRTLTFAWISQVGMLPGTMVYVNAGTQLGKIKSASDVLTPGVLLSFSLIGVTPIVLQQIRRRILSHQNPDRPQ